MALPLVIPKLAMSMTRGTLVDWLRAAGDTVAPGDKLFSLETDKALTDVIAEQGGIVHPVVDAGTVLAPGSVVGYLLEPGEAAPEVEGPVAVRLGIAGLDTEGSVAIEPLAAPSGRVESSPIARRLAREAGLAIEEIEGSGPDGRIQERDVVAHLAGARARRGAPAHVSAVGAGATWATPLAQRAASSRGVDLNTVLGSGPSGRIGVADVESATRRSSGMPPSHAEREAYTNSAELNEGESRFVALSGMRRSIADRMQRSLRDTAQLTLGTDIEFDTAYELRRELLQQWTDVRVSLLDLIVVAAVKALHQHPLLNARLHEDAVELIAPIHIGLATAVDSGLLVPVLRDAARCSLREVSAAREAITAAARARALSGHELAGSTFTITSLGSARVSWFTPILNPPEVAILGVGSVAEGVKWCDDKPVRCRQLPLSLTVDHRVVDGVPAAAFLNTIRELLAHPLELLR